MRRPRESSSARLEALAARVLQLAERIDEERQRTGWDVSQPSAVEEARRFIAGGNADSFHLTKYGNDLGEVLRKLESLPDKGPTYETFEAPVLDDGERLPWETRMKLLTTEAEFFVWMRDDERFFGAVDDTLRQFAPNLYPCYCLWEDVLCGDSSLRYLYESDCEMMLYEIRKHTREND